MDQVLERLRAELAGRYEVEQELGRGGMAVVYLAKDLRHQRRVAIKVLRSDLGSSGNERFLREIRTVSQLHHPHVLGLHDSGSVDGHLFYVMPYVEGETLREKLEREGQLAVEEAVRIAREVADALDFAHGRGIVHRDIKPENIFLSAGHALVADFGIARAADVAKSAIGDTTLTDAGLAVGTPAYMSPEQATADPRIDGRSDQYALGCVLYEMLAGQPPFTGPTSQAVMARHTADPVPPLRTVRAVPAEVESAVRKALAKVPADRWSTARAFTEALGESAIIARGAGRRDGRLKSVLTATGVTTVVIAVALTFIRGRDQEAAARPAIQRLAILPFTVAGDTLWAQQLASGLADALFTGFTRVDGLAPIGGQRMLPYAERAADPRDVARELDVHAVVTGDVRVVGNRVRVTAQLTPVNDGPVWRDEFNADLRVNGELLDVFEIQDLLTVKIIDAMQGELSASGRAAVTRGVLTRDPEAYSLYQRARAAMRDGGRENWGRAVTMLRQSIQRDSTFADAWAALATAIQVHDTWGARPLLDQMIDARNASRKAIDLDPKNALALAERAWWLLLFDWHWRDAWRDMREAVRLAPSDADIAVSYANFLSVLGESDSAVHHASRAVALDPLNPGTWAALGGRLYLASRPDSARVVIDRAIAFDSARVPEAFAWLVHWYLDRGQPDSSAWAVRRLISLDWEVPASYLFSAYYRRVADTTGARAWLNRLQFLSRTQYITPTALASAFLAAGDRAAALDLIERAASARDIELPGNVVLWFDPLVGDDRFEVIRQRIWQGRKLPRSPIP